MISTGIFDDPDHHRQLESPRPGTPRIEQQDSVDHLVVRLMAVAEHDDVDLFVPQLVSKDMRQENSPATDGDAHNFVTIIIIIISADGRHRRDLA